MTKYRYFEIMIPLRKKETALKTLWDMVKQRRITFEEFKEIVKIKEERK